MLILIKMYSDIAMMMGFKNLNLDKCNQVLGYWNGWNSDIAGILKLLG